MSIKVNSPDVTYTTDHIITNYKYESTGVIKKPDGSYLATPTVTDYTFKTKTKVPKFGLMMVGWAGNNGSTGNKNY